MKLVSSGCLELILECLSWQDSFVDKHVAHDVVVDMEMSRCSLDLFDPRLVEINMISQILEWTQ